VRGTFRRTQRIGSGVLSGGSFLLRGSCCCSAAHGILLRGIEYGKLRTKFLDKSGSMGDPTPTYDALVGSLKLEARSLARYWLRDMPAPTWGRPSEFEQLVAPSTTNSAVALLLRQALADVPAYNLTVTDGQVQVLYKLAETFELSAQGGRYVAFAGDYVPLAVGTETTHVPPGLVELSGVVSRAATARAFETRNLPIMEWDAIKTALAADANLPLVARAVAPAPDPNAPAGAPAPVAPTCDVHSVLPVPLHVAILFLKPLSVRAAFECGDSLREVIPDTSRNNYAELFDFLRAAVTQSENDADASAMHTGWAALAIQTGSLIWQRYHRVLHQIEPKEDPRTNGGGGNNGGGDPNPSDPPPPAKSDKTRWHQHQLEILWAVSGIPKADFPLQTESSLPELYQGLKEFRTSSVSSRQYLTKEWTKWKTTERIRSVFVMSTALIGTIRNLDFDGGDTPPTWDGRGKGLSYFALGPHETFKSGKYLQTMDDQTVFELTEEDRQLSLQDRQTHSKSEIINPVPKTRLDTICHLDAVGDRLNFLTPTFKFTPGNARMEGALRRSYTLHQHLRHAEAGTEPTVRSAIYSNVTILVIDQEITHKAHTRPHSASAA